MKMVGYHFGNPWNGSKWFPMKEDILKIFYIYLCIMVFKK